MKRFVKALFPVFLGIMVSACSAGEFGYYEIAPGNYSASKDALDNEDPGQQQDPQFEGIVENPFVKVADQPVSTFSVDADGASYAYLRRCLTSGYYFNPQALRTEELLNYFTFNYSDPTGDETLGINAELGPCPWNGEHQLLRLGLKGKSLQDSEIPAANFILLVDTSGSMSGDDRIELLKTGLCEMVDCMKQEDRIAIITYSGSVSMALESTLCKDASKIKKVIRGLQASGSTAGGAAMKMAYDEATEHYITGGNNRIIMCTDGDFNVGTSSTDELVEMVESYLNKGIYLSIMGFGYGNYQDARMESLAGHGNGTYTYIDSEEEMMKVFVHERSHFYSVANDTKCQITFTDAVDSYRLIGYEHRIMNNEDFENDSKDAGEIGAGQTVTALYELIPAEQFVPAVQAATFDVRYKKALGGESRPLSIDVTVPPASAQNTTEFNFAAGITAFSLTLRESPYKGSASFDMAKSLVANGIGPAPDPLKLRNQLLNLIDKAASLTNQQNNRQ